MKKKKLALYFLIFFFIGMMVTVINYYYPLEKLYWKFNLGEMNIDPDCEISEEKTYNLQVWYPPFLRTISPDEEKEIEKALLSSITSRVKNEYENINLDFRRLLFLEKDEVLQDAFTKGRPPDIYFNFSNDPYVSPKWQIPVEPYIEKEEKNKYYTVNWSEINRRNHLWGWPLLFKQELWLGKGKSYDSINIKDKTQFISLTEKMEEESLFFYYYNPLLLRQLLFLNGLDDINITEGKLDEKTIKCFEKTLNYLEGLKNKQIISRIDQSKMIKGFLENEFMVLAPVNIWLSNYFQNRAEIKTFNFPAHQVFTINVFKQEDYRGDDHIKAAMMVAKIISKEISEEMAGYLNVRPAYGEYNVSYSRLPKFDPPVKKLWREKIMALWIDYWEDELSAAEVISALKKIEIDSNNK